MDKAIIKEDKSEDNTLNDTNITRTRKSKDMFAGVKVTMEKFLDSFNSYFYDEIYQTITQGMEAILEDKNKKNLEIAKNYNDQIKEMEFLINSGNLKLILDNEETYKDSIKGLIQSLKEEQQLELDKLDDLYDEKIKEMKAKFRHDGLRNNPGVRLLEEKFRLDMLNSINIVVFANKKTNK
jgi:hypothetical protein